METVDPFNVLVQSVLENAQLGLAGILSLKSKIGHAVLVLQQMGGFCLQGLLDRCCYL